MTGGVATLGPLPEWGVVALAGVVGLMMGSFLNVVAYRTPRGLSVVQPPSFCPKCRTPVRPRDNVPVASWVILGGHCRACGEPISVRYPLVESATGVLFAVVALAVGPHWAVGGLCAAAGCAASLLAIELDGLRPPPSVAVIGTALSLLLLSGAAIADRLWAHLAGAVAGGAVAVVVALVVTRWSPPSEHGGRLRGVGWVLLPAGVVLGWTGPIGAAAGMGALGVLVLVLPAARRPVPEAQPGGVEAAGIAFAMSLSCVTAVAVAVAVGSALGG